MIRFIDVYKEYDNGTKALKGINLRIDDGEFVFLVGPSGSGKSTIIKLITGEIGLTEGKLMVNGYSLNNISPRQVPLMRRTLGIIFQDFRLIDKKTVYENLSFAMRAIGASNRDLKRRIPYVLQLVGLEKKADTRPIYQMAAPELLEKPQVGTMKELDVEATAALESELVIMPQALADYADTLTQLGIPVLVVNPESHEALVEMLQLMGTALGLEDRAEALTSYYQEQLDRMAELTQDTEAPVVYMGSNSSFLATAPASMYQSTLIRQAGGVNAGDSLEGDYWTEVSYEDVLAMAPQVVVLPAGAEYTVQDVLEDPQLSALPAVQDGAVYQMPGGIEEWDSPVPSGILGTMWMTSVLHPNVYPFEEFTADAQDFYQTFYGFSVDASLITK